jgi:hypothetical protein
MDKAIVARNSEESCVTICTHYKSRHLLYLDINELMMFTILIPPSHSTVMKAFERAVEIDGEPT